MQRHGRRRHWLLAPCVLAAMSVWGPTTHVNGQERTLAPDVRAKLDGLLDQVAEAEAELKIKFRRSKLVRAKIDIQRVAVADPSIVEIVAFGTKEVELIGREVGATTVTLWMGDADNTSILSFLVTVTHDTGVEDRRKLEYGELEGMINELFPGSRVQLLPIADKLIVRGQARDVEEATHIMAMIRRRGQGSAQGGGQGSSISAGSANADAADVFPDGSSLPSAGVINMLRIPGEQQVMLKVRIAELKRSAVRNLGVNFEFEVGEFLAESAVAAGVPNQLLAGTFSEDSFNVLLEALEQNGVAKILAQPNLTVLSGNSASFLAGGEFAVPTVVGVQGAQAVSTMFHGFGTQLRFTPTVLDKDRIRLQVNPVFSTLNRENAVNGVFGLDTRSASTVVELREGQVLAIAGLIQEQTNGSRNAVPGLGKIPGAGILFNSKQYTRDETELVVLVSPELAHAFEPEDVPAYLPGMEVTEPDDVDFYLLNRIEGRPNEHHRSTVWPAYRDAMLESSKRACYQESSGFYINGNHGFSR